MKTYIGTKQVKAEPMNELAAVEKGYARKNEDNHEWREGYHVQYTNPDGSTYDSWSPKSVFEQAYKCADSFLDRLQIERDELKERYDKLSNLENVDTVKNAVQGMLGYLVYSIQAWVCIFTILKLALNS